MSVFEVFREPPRAYSPAAIWWWSGEPLRRDRLRWQLERLVAGGVHNLVILNLAPSGPMFGADADDPPFLSDAWWELLDGVCADAHELGAYLWFYDQLGFSGADLQARLVQERPEFAGQWLAPDGSVSLRGFDYLSREACAVLLDRVHGEFERRVGHWFGKVIAGSFQDELPTLPTWSARFAEEHLARRGRPYSAGDRRAYQLTRAELAEEAFFRPLAEWHERHGLVHGCDQQDPARAGHPADGVRLYADYARTHRWFGAPGSDHHGDARLHSSLAHLYGRPRTWIEAFHSSGWGGTLEETFDWLVPWLRAGATLYNPHAVYYTTRRGWWEWAPPSTDWRQPYWRHHRVFAEAVTRLCAALSLGRHACDVAVLLPTATAQAGVGADGVVGAGAARAQEVYRELVGDMAWFATSPGVLDRLGLDADVVDEDSVRRAVVKDGRLTVATEAYRVVILPAVTTLDEEVAARLAEFAEGGGLLVAVGAPAAAPPGVPAAGAAVWPGVPAAGAVASVGDPAAGAVAAAVSGLGARFVDSADRLGEALGGLERRVEAPVPALVREDGETTLVFLPATFPMASRIRVGRPEERGVDLGWLDAIIDFEPGRYAREMPITVRGVSGTPLLLRPFAGGHPVPLPHTRDGDTVRVVVPFDDGPAALLVFDGTDAAPAPRPAYPVERDLGEEWHAELVPTLDDTWSDFGSGPGGGVECWTLRTPDGEPVDVTFGPRGEQRVGDGPWTPSVWSLSRGLRKDPVHREVLGPKGRVPVEFLAFGRVAAGGEARFRTLVTVPAGGAWLALGAGAAKTVWIDGAERPLDDRGYSAVTRSPLPAGEQLLEVLLVPEEELDLRAYACLVSDPADAVRPEWIGGTPLETVVHVDGGGRRLLQVASTAFCRVLVNGVEAGRQGGFDPYEEADIPRVRRYDVTDLLREGDNSVRVECEGWVLVDGLVVSGPGWSPAPRVRRRQYGDPAALWLLRRPHPLPEAGWLDGGPVAPPAAFAVPGARSRTERFLLDPPPGATGIEVDAVGEWEVRWPPGLPVRGAPVERPQAGAHAERPLSGTQAERPLPGAPEKPPVPPAPVELVLHTTPDAQAGAALAGPVRFTCGPGRMRLGDWEEQGLAGYSGGVRYRTTVPARSGPGQLDLGRVRGSAEVRVNGRPCGVRVCSPYVFDVELDDGDNLVEILILGTLAPYLDEVSPTHFVFPGQRTTGLFGPVRLREAG
ncbi:hypothetical protein [Nonomuraea gerenzanensis]|uniref:Glycoside hydrolase family 2, sugar binding n=1 Tax=Nonomuraea gerenzanensis TaxID=93944 RepID=A0A1M4EFP5_9ACTN|nr:hypothetical protein [Nonomuraea gerenzanensis]UBU09326.1 hypothetical protein LCN96_33775 [Nonomuraea gerenzanensis]SBO97735.1 glycoside hydrolase family 2, sugar binding [Nonomuraea gerenzanensis]